MKIKKVIKKKLIISSEHSLLKNWKNINGPVCFRVPSWIKRPLGKYYLLFSDHQGTYIRLAYSDNINSEWKISKIKILEVTKFKKIIYDHIASPEIYLDHKNKNVCVYFHSNFNFKSRFLNHCSKSGKDLIRLLSPCFFNKLIGS